MKRQSINLALAAVGLCAATMLRADTISFDLGLGNAAISGYTGPYAHVVVDRTSSTTATITFTSLTGGGNIFLLGDGGSVAVNVNANSWTLGAITGSNVGTGFDPGNPYSNGGSGNEDGWGSFNQTINSFDGYTHSSSTISFTLTDTSGTWASAANVLLGNGSGYLAAAHIFVAGDPADANAPGGALATGFATGDGSSVPDGGSTVALLGCGLAGIGMISRKFLKN